MDQSLATVHVLVVDDSPAIRGVLTEALRCAGATVTATDTAQRALDLVEQLRPDVLLSDLEMPAKGGDWCSSEEVREEILDGVSDPDGASNAMTSPTRFVQTPPCFVTLQV